LSRRLGGDSAALRRVQALLKLADFMQFPLLRAACASVLLRTSGRGGGGSRSESGRSAGDLVSINSSYL
jgi:hypothetical protein